MEAASEYVVIAKGRGCVYAYDDQLYQRVKTRGAVKYLKCVKVGCDGSAKIDNAGFHIAVSTSN